MVKIVGNDEVLEALEELHSEEEEDASGEILVLGLVVDPPSGKETEAGEPEGRFLVEAHS